VGTRLAKFALELVRLESRSDSRSRDFDELRSRDGRIGFSSETDTKRRKTEEPSGMKDGSSERMLSRLPNRRESRRLDVPRLR